jgi:hypothetical protein
MADAADIDYILKDTPNANEFALVSYVKASLIKLKPADFPTENTTLYKDFPHRVASAVEKYGNYLYREQDISRTGNGFVGFLFTKPTGSGTSKTRIKHIRKQDDGTVRKITSYEVDGNTIPAVVTGKDITQEQIDNTHSYLESDEIVSGGTRTDYSFHPITSAKITTTREVVAQSIPSQSSGTVVKQKQLRDDWAARVTDSLDITALTTFLEGSPSYIHNLPLPTAVLTGVDIKWALDYKNGAFSTNWAGAASGDAYSLTGSEQGSAEASGSAVPIITPQYKHYKSGPYPSTTYAFFLPRPVTRTDILTKLGGIGSVTQWPIFKEETHTIALVGGKTGIQARASASASVAHSPSGDSHDLTQGTGDNYDKSVTAESVIIGPCIHGAINFGGESATKSQSLTATAAAQWSAYGSFPAATATKSATATVEGSVSPTSLSATTPSAVSTTGLYLVDFETEMIPDINYSMVLAHVIDATVLA